MQAPVIHANERQRLESLESIRLSREREARFSELVELAAFVAHTPMASISIVDADAVWFKAEVGLGDGVLVREASLCAHIVAAAKPVVVPDTRLDERFRDNPLVIGGPKVRFYAGVPLIIDDDLPIGTLCVMDNRPRTFLTDERRALHIIANQAITQMRLHRLTPA